MDSLKNFKDKFLFVVPLILIGHMTLCEILLEVLMEDKRREHNVEMNEGNL